jgi:predicted GNAT family acetyltransferase
MLRTSSPVRTLGLGDVQHAMEVCARDPVTNVFVAARILEGGLSSGRVAVLGYDDGDEQGLCWAGANIVPVECTPAMVVAFAEKVARRRRSASSLCGPADAVLHLWSLLEPEWGQAREVRAVQPVLTMAVSPSAAGVAADPLVRAALDHELDLVVPAAAAMFTEEIGYPPYQGSDRAYRTAVAQLIRDRRTLVRVEDGQVVFKADIGSVALGVAQVQGVWVHPDRRGRGLAVPAMAAVVDYARRHLAPTVTLYVNDFNAPALATYRRVGFVRTGTFATVLL